MMRAEFSDSSNYLEVPAASLQPGMYVAALDRPWLETPFALQGFYITSREDAEFVAEHCAFVYVDPRRRSTAAEVVKHAKPRRTYRERSDLKSEIKTAEVDLTSANEAMAKVFGQLKTGAHLDVDVIRAAVNPLLESVLRNSQALAALVRMKRRGDYLYGHSIAVAVWAAVLGRHLGLDRDQLEKLVLGAALLDVGMTRIDEAIPKSSEPLNDRTRTEVRSHVDLSLTMLKEAGDVPGEIIEMVGAHHERFDGSGYPHGTAGMEIPMFARIAGLVDSYDAMITSRPFAGCRSSFEAMQELADAKDLLFQGALVEQFMQAIGLFPTGSVVELNTGEIGIVVQQNSARRLRPKVALVLDGQGNRHATLTVIDLASYGTGGGQGDRWITRELEPGAHGIQPDEFFL
ncbi:MAG: HD-GYP domain-containing protein [Pseudomonadales bacterium]